MKAKSNQNTFPELLQVFFKPLRQLFKLIVRYSHTSMMVLTARDVLPHLQNPEKGMLKDTRYAFATFEFLLLFLFLTKILGVAADLDELGESFQEFTVLLLYLVCLLAYVGFSRIWRWLLRLDVSARLLDGFFLMEYSFLFLPSYLILHPVYRYDPDDEETIGVFTLLVSVLWMIHMIYYFYRMCKALQLGTGKTILTVTLVPLISFVLLFLSVFMTIGAAVLE